MNQRIAFFLFFLWARAASQVPRYLLVGCDDDNSVDQLIKTYITAGKYVAKEEKGLFLADIEHSNSSYGKPMQIISTHPSGNKEDSMIALLNYIEYGAIDGVLTAVEDEDERVDLIRELHLTSIPHRQPTCLPILFKQSGNHKFIHYGEHFTFIGDLDNKMIQVNRVFQMSQKVRIMDSYWVYRRAHIETSYSGISRASKKLNEDYALSLFNCLVGHQLPLELLLAAIQQGNLKLIAYVIDEIPKPYMQSLKNLLKGLFDTELPELEIGSPLHQLKLSYDPLHTCSVYTGYHHESFETIVSIRIRAIEEEAIFNTKKAEIETSISRFEDLEKTAKIDIETAGDMNNLNAHWTACVKLDEIVSIINRYYEELDQLRKKHQEVMQSYKLQVDEAYYI